MDPRAEILLILARFTAFATLLFAVAWAGLHIMAGRVRYVRSGPERRLAGWAAVVCGALFAACAGGVVAIEIGVWWP